MKTIFEKENLLNSILAVKPYWFLLAGIITMGFSHLSFNIDILAWISMVPFLIYLDKTKGFKSRIIFLLALIFSWSVIVSKITTEPGMFFLIPMYSIPIALFHLPGYLIYSWLKNSKLSPLAFPSAMVIIEWVQYSFTPLGSWGVAAYTQTDSLAISQMLSIFGMPGLSFLIYFSNVLLAQIIQRKPSNPAFAKVFVSIMTALVLLGSIRISIYNSRAKDSIQVAAVGTDSKIGGLPLPSRESNEAVIQDIFRRTTRAADFGAKLVVWTEAAFFMLTEDESDWIDSISYVAKKNDVAIVASYILLISESPLKYENKFLFVNSDGNIDDKYLKHQPVPGEPAIKGTDEFKCVTIGNTNIGGAICYDYDFPYIAKENRKIGADIVALPSSDWRGIDPLHSEMAAFRAIEQGHSIIRSTRFGLSAGINPIGQITSSLSSYDKNNKILISNLPRERVKTVYSYIGDILVYLLLIFLCFLIVQHFLIKRSDNSR